MLVNEKRYATGPMVDRRYNVRPPWRWRQKRNPKSKFPRPLMINGREQYERTRVSRCAAERDRVLPTIAAKARKQAASKMIEGR